MSFPTSSRFSSACLLCNKIPASKFPLVLKRILQKLHIKNASSFTPAEASQLASGFGLTPLELADCLAALQHAFSRAAYSAVKPAALAATCVGASMGEEHGEMMAKAWEAEAAGVVKRLRESAVVGAPKVLENTDWSLSVNMSSSTLTSTKTASARFEFDLAVPNGGGEEETLAVEFSHEELYELFKKLEQVQGQLDELT